MNLAAGSASLFHRGLQSTLIGFVVFLNNFGADFGLVLCGSDVIYIASRTGNFRQRLAFRSDGPAAIHFFPHGSAGT